MHWADVIASRLEETKDVHKIATGITPSGHIHVGNMREILTGDLIYKAAREKGVNASLYYLADDFDPLRKVYPFLPEKYSEHVGKPLSEIPSPGGDGGSYAEYFLEPFLRSVEELGITPIVLPSSISYKEGKYAEVISKLLDNMDRVKEILERVSGRELPEDWLPYNAKCRECGRIDTTKALSFEPPYVNYICSCGYEGKADTRTDDGKLPWRLDWPARWYWLGVTCEPFGKDHAASGGSYDTSSEIMRGVLGKEPPIPLVYEWIQLKGKGAMSSSTGVVVSGVDMLKMIPPEVLRFLITRNQPNRHIDMDPGLGILNLVDEFDKYEEHYYQGEENDDPDDRKRIYELSMVRGTGDREHMKRIVNVPYRHLVTLTQLSPDMETLLEKIKRTEKIKELDSASMERLVHRRSCVEFWLDNFAPDGVRFTLFDLPPKKEIDKLNEKMKEALEAMRDEFGDIEWNAEAIHNTIYEGSRSREISPKTTFKAFYRILLGRDRGPRLGFFLSSMDRGDVMKKLEFALESGI
ncbi:MAG: lysine--tRNA ligase [Candidatus Thermoplasmatota archaeon]|nr:lysine--tRNA ligase [Candidatus Thermoplasmatota archaeon]